MFKKQNHIYKAISTSNNLHYSLGQKNIRNTIIHINLVNIIVGDIIFIFWYTRLEWSELKIISEKTYDLFINCDIHHFSVKRIIH